jgi:hypothetical protein
VNVRRRYCTGCAIQAIPDIRIGSSVTPALDDASRPSAGRPLDRTAVLVAGLCWTLLGPWFPLYGGQGLRILAQVGPRQNGLAPVRISGVSSTLPLPESARIFSEALVALSERIADVFALPEEVSLVDVGISLPDGHTAKEQAPIIFAKTAPPTEYPRGDYSYEGTSYLLVMRANEKFPRGIEPLARRPLVTAADADVFVQDPISRKGAGYFTKLRPSRSWLVLDPERVNVPLGNLPPGAGANVQLVDPDPNEPPKPNFRVTNARLVDPPWPKATRSKWRHRSTNTSARTRSPLSMASIMWVICSAACGDTACRWTAILSSSNGQSTSGIVPGSSRAQATAAR